MRNDFKFAAIASFFIHILIFILIISLKGFDFKKESFVKIESPIIVNFVKIGEKSTSKEFGIEGIHAEKIVGKVDAGIGSVKKKVKSKKKKLKKI